MPSLILATIGFYLRKQNYISDTIFIQWKQYINFQETYSDMCGSPCLSIVVEHWFYDLEMPSVQHILMY